jgi:hypothetical protein
MATKRPDGRVEPGQRISSAFSARAWNRAQDAADVVLGARTSVSVDGVRLPMSPWVVVYAQPDVGTPRFGAPYYLGARQVKIPDQPLQGITPFTETPQDAERQIIDRNDMQALLSASYTHRLNPVTSMVGVCIDPLNSLFCIRGIVPVRVMAPTITATAVLASNLSCAVIYEYQNHSYARLVSAGGFRVQPITPLPPAGGAALSPTQGWGIAML